MIFANKQDIEGAMTPSEVANALGLTSITTHKYQIFKTSAIKGTGLEEAMEWWVLITHSFFSHRLLLEIKHWSPALSHFIYLHLQCFSLFDCLILDLFFSESHEGLNNLLCYWCFKHALEKSLL